MIIGSVDVGRTKIATGLLTQEAICQGKEVFQSRADYLGNRGTFYGLPTCETQL